MPSRKRSTKSKPKVLNPIMERAAEVNPESQSSESPQNESQSNGGLLSNLKSLFQQSPESQSSESPKAAEGSAVSSGEPSTTCDAPALSPEIESALAAVPDLVDGGADVVTVEDGEDGEGDVIAAVALSNRAKIDALIALGYVDEDDAGELFDSLFEWIAARAESEHWKLKDKQRAKLARPGAACINATLQKLFDALPESVGNTASAHPEVTALALALGSVAGPKLLKQLKVRKDKRAGVAPSSGGSAPAAPVKSAGVVKAAGGAVLGGIPVATGTLQ